jgi:hypothetical protein
MIWGLNNYRQCFRASSRYAATLPGYGSIEPVYEKKPSVYQKNSCGLWMWNPNQKLLVMGKKIHPQMRKWVLSMKSWTSSSSDMFQSKPLKVTSPDLGPLISPCRSDFFPGHIHRNLTKTKNHITVNLSTSPGLAAWTCYAQGAQGLGMQIQWYFDLFNTSGWSDPDAFRGDANKHGG